MSPVNFLILALSTNFVLLKLTCLVTLFGRKLWVFKNSPKWTIFDIFNQLLSIQNVNVARFARNVEWDFFCDFQTPCDRSALDNNAVSKHFNSFHFLLTQVWAVRSTSSKHCQADNWIRSGWKSALSFHHAMDQTHFPSSHWMEHAKKDHPRNPKPSPRIGQRAQKYVGSQR